MLEAELYSLRFSGVLSPMPTRPEVSPEDAWEVSVVDAGALSLLALRRCMSGLVLTAFTLFAYLVATSRSSVGVGLITRRLSSILSNAVIEAICGFYLTQVGGDKHAILPFYSHA